MGDIISIVNSKYIDQKANELAKLTHLQQEILKQAIKYEREIRQLTEKNVSQALKLQARENERRLEGLNNEYARITKILSETVPREVWQNNKDEQEKWNFTVMERFAETRGERKKANTLMGLGLFVVAILSFIINVYYSRTNIIPNPAPVQVVNPVSAPVPTVVAPPK